MYLMVAMSGVNSYADAHRTFYTPKLPEVVRVEVFVFLDTDVYNFHLRCDTFSVISVMLLGKINILI